VRGFFCINLLLVVFQSSILAADLDFSLLDRQGKAWRPSDFQGNFVLLNFWATWCPPCIEELPMMEALNQKFKAKNFSMIAVSVDNSWEEIDKFFQKGGSYPSFLILLDSPKAVSRSLGTEKFPETYLISKEGKILKKFVGPINWMNPKILAEFEDFFRKAK
jgi:thiol-disulfide isomerase/thioredoxin